MCVREGWDQSTRSKLNDFRFAILCREVVANIDDSSTIFYQVLKYIIIAVNGNNVSVVYSHNISSCLSD